MDLEENDGTQYTSIDVSPIDAPAQNLSEKKGRGANISWKKLESNFFSYSKSLELIWLKVQLSKKFLM